MSKTVIVLALGALLFALCSPAEAQQPKKVARLDTFTILHQKRILEFAAKSRLPAMCERSDYAETGCLMSYSADELESYRQTAIYVDKILKGTKPSELPVEQPMKFDFVVNLKTAKQIGVTISPNVLARADKVIK